MTLPEEYQVQETNKEKILQSYRDNVPTLGSVEDPEKKEALTEQMKTKFSEILDLDFKSDKDAENIIQLFSEAIAISCIAYNIDPLELILLPSSLDGKAIGSASITKVAGIEIKKVTLDPLQILLDIELYKRAKEMSIQNITDTLFVVSHEMAHIGQETYVPELKSKNDQFDYLERPNEIHADEEALDYCRSLNAQLTNKNDLTVFEKHIQVGLNTTIKKCEENRRPSF